MCLRAAVAILVLAISLCSAFTPCVQRFGVDIRADENDCKVFHMCTMGQLVTFTCSAGSVYHERSHTCVPANSIFDTCSSRMAANTRCPQGFRGLLPHPNHCAQYYECGASQSQNRRGWESQLRECPYPFVFSDNKCVLSSPGLCGAREEPLDHCDYKENQCETNAHCVPCHVRFPTCRGRPDGDNAWSGRPGTPYYVTCRQQRVHSMAMCEQKGAVFIFDESRRECVKLEPEVEKPEVPETPAPVQQARPQTTPRPGGNVQNMPVGYQPLNLGHQNGYQQGGYRPQYSVQTPTQNQNQNQYNPYQHNPSQNQYVH